MKAMSQIRRAILETLSQRGPLSINEIARLTHRSVMATRYHLGLLLDEGAVVIDTVAHHATVGRPQMVYTLANGAHQQLPKQYDVLALNLLDEVMRMLGEKEERALLRRVGKRLATAAPPLRRAARLETRLGRATDFLNQRGYLTQWQKMNGEYTLSIGNCPYRQVALTHRHVCDMDIALVGALLNVPMKMSLCIAHQDSQCVFVVKPTANKK
jgi:predicted ArsR family transcriptional regulator